MVLSMLVAVVRSADLVTTSYLLGNYHTSFCSLYNCKQLKIKNKAVMKTRLRILNNYIICFQFLSFIVVEFSLLCCTSMAHPKILRHGRKKFLRMRRSAAGWKFPSLTGGGWGKKRNSHTDLSGHERITERSQVRRAYAYSPQYPWVLGGC